MEQNSYVSRVMNSMFFEAHWNTKISCLQWWIRGVLDGGRRQPLFFTIFWRTSSHFCGATDIPVLDFWWRLLWVSKPKWTANLALAKDMHGIFPEFHFWCDTFAGVYSQYSGWSLSPHVCFSSGSSIGSSGQVGGGGVWVGKKHEVYVAAFGSYLFYDLFL